MEEGVRRADKFSAQYYIMDFGATEEAFRQRVSIRETKFQDNFNTNDNADSPSFRPSHQNRPIRNAAFDSVMGAVNTPRPTRNILSRGESL